jgi:hypothetical protein
VQNDRIYLADDMENWWKESIARRLEGKTVQEVIDGWQSFSKTCTRSEYDAKTETWRFIILMFDENYGTMIPKLAMLRGIECFKKENPDDFIIVANYFWSGKKSFERATFLHFKEGKSTFHLEKIPDYAILESARHFDGAIAALNTDSDPAGEAFSASWSMNDDLS